MSRWLFDLVLIKLASWHLQNLFLGTGILGFPHKFWGSSQGSARVGVGSQRNWPLGVFSWFCHNLNLDPVQNSIWPDVLGKGLQCKPSWEGWDGDTQNVPKFCLKTAQDVSPSSCRGHSPCKCIFREGFSVWSREKSYSVLCALLWFHPNVTSEVWREPLQGKWEFLNSAA